MIAGFRQTPADRKLLPDGRFSGAAPWVIAIMMFLMILAAAGGLGLAQAARGLGSDIADKLTIQIVEANPDAREVQTRAALRELSRMAEVRRVRRVPENELKALVEPWLGAEAANGDIPLPAMIDVTLARAEAAQPVRLAIGQVAPAARVDEHARSLAPLAGLIDALKWLAAGVVMLMATATAAVVVLASGGALNTHRSTIDVMHLLGATDLQIARIFQRRIAFDALFGGGVGLVAALVVLLLIGTRLAAIGSELVGSIALPASGWIALLLLPLFGTVLAMTVTRFTVLRLLRNRL